MSTQTDQRPAPRLHERDGALEATERSGRDYSATVRAGRRGARTGAALDLRAVRASAGAGLAVRRLPPVLAGASGSVRPRRVGALAAGASAAALRPLAFAFGAALAGRRVVAALSPTSRPPLPMRLPTMDLPVVSSYTALTSDSLTSLPSASRAYAAILPQDSFLGVAGLDDLLAKLRAGPEVDLERVVALGVLLEVQELEATLRVRVVPADGLCDVAP